MMKQRTLSPYESLAIDPKAVQRGPQSFFLLAGPSIAPNERVGPNDDVAVVNIRGALDQFADSFCDNYESIVGRVRMALSGEDVERGAAVDPDDSHPPSSSAPKAVILRISSPGGVVAGLNETVAKLRAMARAAGVPLIAYADECAASAAYALACACDKIYTTASGITGSIGVISMLESYVRMLQKDGIDMAVIASGERKTDGHPALPLDDDAIDAERARVEELAVQFFNLVSEARGLSPDDIRSYEAGIFLGHGGVDAGLVDDILPFDELLARVCQVVPQSEEAAKQADGVGKMTVQSLIRKTTAAIAAEKDPAKLAALKGKLASYQATLAAMQPEAGSRYRKERHVIEEEEIGDDDEPADDEDETEESAESAETDESAESAETDDSEESAEDEALEKEGVKMKKAEDEKQASMRGEYDARIASLENEISVLRAGLAAKERHSRVSAAVKAGRITPAEAKALVGKKSSYVTAFLAARKTPVVTVDHPTPAGKAPRLTAVVHAAEITPEMREIAAGIEQRSNGKIKADTIFAEMIGESKEGRY